MVGSGQYQKRKKENKRNRTGRWERNCTLSNKQEREKRRKLEGISQ